MANIHSSKNHQNDDCGNCEEKDTPTQRSINSARKKYCDELYVTAGAVGKYETQYEGQVAVYNDKKCLFVWTEGNYRRYRNTEMGIVTELLQSNELIKTNVSNYMVWSSELSSGLKNIVKSVKDLKTKLGDLRDAACKLESCINDDCNCTQMAILTGEVGENCDEKDEESEDNRPKECEDSKEILDDLICMPKALGFDAGYLLKSSSDVMGIQVFSNIGTLEPLQKTFSDEAKAFGKLIQETTKKRESDLKKAQDDLIKSVQETTKTASGLYNERSDFEGLMCTTKFICCPSCDCVKDDEGDCEPRLGKCKEEICDICDKVKDTFCDCSCAEEEEAK